MLTLCQCISTPIMPEKVVHPFARITFLGTSIVIDTKTMAASLSNECNVSILEELHYFHWETLICLPCWTHLSTSPNKFEYDSQTPSPPHSNILRSSA